jgi:hypothetical protein
MLIEELETMARDPRLYANEAACPECGEERGFGTRADWTRCRFCAAPFEFHAGQGD